MHRLHKNAFLFGLYKEAFIKNSTPKKRKGAYSKIKSVKLLEETKKKKSKKWPIAINIMHKSGEVWGHYFKIILNKSQFLNKNFYNF